MSRLTRIEIDLNSLDRKGHLRARLARANGPVSQGDSVIVFEFEDNIAADAVVVEVDKTYNFVTLNVDWDTMRDDE